MSYLNRMKKQSKQLNSTILEKNLTDFIKDKRVIIIGPSPWMTDKKLGKLIDSYDIVVRLNSGLVLPKKNPTDFGSRTDLLYINQKIRRTFDSNLPEEWFTSGIKHISIVFQQLHVDLPKDKNKCYLCAKDMVKGQFIDGVTGPNLVNKDQHYLIHYDCGTNSKIDYDSYPIPIIRRSLNEFDYLKKLMKTKETKQGEDYNLLIGVHAFLDLIRREPAEIHVTGFDFYSALKSSDSDKMLIDPETEEIIFDTIYCKDYEVIEGSLKESHKDAENIQRDLFKEIYCDMKKVNTFKTIVTIDDHLNDVLFNRSRKDLQKDLREKLKEKRSMRSRRV